MRILKLELNLWHRLLSADVRHFEITPTSDMQLILGTNGSGKTSLLAELTPWPAESSDFAAGGGKRVFIEHRGHHWELENHYEKTKGSGRHRFYNQTTQEEFNPGGTLAVQKTLVVEHFGLDKELRDLLIDRDTFTAMSTAKRREWLTRLAPMDLSFAFDLYKKAREAHRDRQALVKHHNTRLQKENQDLPDEATLHGFRQQHKDYTEKLNALFARSRAGLEKGFTQNNIEDQLKQLEHRLSRLLIKTPYLPPDKEHPQQAIVGLQQQLSEEQTLLTRATQEYHRLQDEKPQTPEEDLTPEKISALKQQLHDLSQRHQHLSQQIKPQAATLPCFDLPLDRRPREQLKTLYGAFRELLHTIPSNDEGYFNRQAGQDAQQRYGQLENEHRQLNNDRNIKASRLARLKGCETIECPNCQHTFKPGIDPREITKLDQDLTHLQQQEETLDQELTTLRNYLDAFTEYMTYVREFRQLTQEYPLFEPLWNFANEHRMAFRTPFAWVAPLHQWHDQMLLRIDVAELDDQCQVLKHRLRFIDALDQDAMAQTRRHLEQLEQEINRRTFAIRQLQQELQKQQQHLNILQRYVQQCQDALAEGQAFFDAVAKEQQWLQQQSLEADTRYLQVQLAQTQEVLSRHELRAGVLQDIERQQKQATQEHEDYNVLVKALSPRDGLIGQYLLGFLQHVVEFVNAVIGRIWTYSLEVLPSPVKKDELTYQFPLWVKGGVLNPPDIANGSKAQQAVVNFAFKLLAVRFLGLQEYPLYLDELASEFDEEHQRNAMDLIVSMLELDQVQQVFFISHYAAHHGVFTQAEVCVMDDTNITVPEIYNQHVVMR